MAVTERVRSLVAPVVAASDIELVDVEHTGPALRVVVDRPGGLDLDAITELTREISRLLDAEDPLAGRYTLEVSTPGLERPLRAPEHFMRAVGATVSIKTMPDVPGERRFTGLLRSADEHGIVVQLGPPGPEQAAEPAEGIEARHLDRPPGPEQAAEPAEGIEARHLDRPPGPEQPAELAEAIEARHLAYGEVERARTVFEWGPGPKPGKGSKPGAARASKAASKPKNKSKRQATTS